ncbi:Disease resistance protein [Melia azedarach]|uniref:Disease resistance protein n=1 Tax=Melia azedarach TaxID=155640 RepID=A0ACC1XZ85_MELAZ|nr:Disease resistance protein [Melia azedarach]
MIGIWGMGGLGKTTIARAIYDLISSEFEGSSFLADVREICEKKGLISLQKKLLSELLKLTDRRLQNVYEGMNILGSRLRHKKVLLVIDDVVTVKQLKSLARKHDWFGPGSRIIITSRDEHLLTIHGVDEVYKLGELNVDEACRLFFMEAFKAHEPMKDFVRLSKRAVQYAAGLPLALRVLGSFLYGRTVEEWKSALQRLKRDSSNEILDILQISFDGLQEEEKKIFLDIACFFKGEDIDYVTNILEDCDFDPIIGIRVLVEKSLISVNHNKLWMHDLLQEMGHQIVKRESKEPGKRSRLWEEADARHMFSENTGTEVIEGITFNCFGEVMHLSAAAFSKMTNLRLLKISNVQLPEGLDYLSNELRLLEWHRYPLKSLPSNFQLEKTFEFDMYHSSIEQLWQGMKHLNMLKVVRLTYCPNLIKTPDFTGVLNLEELILIGCAKLQEIHPSLLVHRKLAILTIKDCTSLKSLPRKIGVNSLKKLVLTGCSKLKNFPEIGSSMEYLSELFLDGTGITRLPLSIELLPALVLLSLKDCKSLEILPSTIGGLKCMKILNLSGCSKLKKFPEIMESMECLSELLLDGTAIKDLPSSLDFLLGLVLLNLKDCKNLQSLSTATIHGLKRLKVLNLSGCSKLRKFPEIMERMECLSELSLDGSAIEELPLSIKLLSGLTLLNLSNCNNLVRLPSTINGLKSLKTLNLSGCSKT